MFFESWETLFRVIIVSIISYPLLIVVLRLTGKRSLSQMSSFDFIVTVAIGSMYATLLISKKLPIIEGLAAITTLLFLQWAVTYTATRSKSFEKLIKSNPTLLYYDNAFIEEAMKKERVVKDEVYSAVRQAGHASIREVSGVVLENNGTLSVLSGEVKPAHDNVIIQATVPASK